MLNFGNSPCIEDFDSAPIDPFTGRPSRYPPPLIVIDIGGSQGQFVREVYRAFPKVRIYSFQQIATCFEELNILSQEIQAPLPRQFTLSDTMGFGDFNVSAFSDSNLFQTMRPEHLEAWTLQLCRPLRWSTSL